jgi:hypothetical protein
MERHGHLTLDPIVRQLLLAVSPATIDRLLAPIRGTAGRRRKPKRVTESSRPIPIRTFADWNDPGPGFLEVDFVAHGGDSMVVAGSRSLDISCRCLYANSII